MRSLARPARAALRRLRIEASFSGGRTAEQWIPLDLLWFVLLLASAPHALMDAFRIRYRGGRSSADRTFAGNFSTRLDFYMRRPLGTWIDRFSLPRWRRRFTVDGLDQLERLIADRPVIVVTLHTPNVGMLGIWLLSRGIPTASIALNDRWRTQPTALRRAHLPGRLGASRSFTVGNARPMVRYLTPGHCLLVPADWIRGHAVELKWQDRTLTLSTGPFRLARISGAAVLPVLVVGTGHWRWRIIIGEPVPDALIERGDIPAAATACGSQLLAALAHWPRDRPPGIDRAPGIDRPPEQEWTPSGNPASNPASLPEQPPTMPR